MHSIIFKQHTEWEAVTQIHSEWTILKEGAQCIKVVVVHQERVYDNASDTDWQWCCWSSAYPNTKPSKQRQLNFSRLIQKNRWYNTVDIGICRMLDRIGSTPLFPSKWSNPYVLSTFSQKRGREREQSTYRVAVWQQSVRLLNVWGSISWTWTLYINSYLTQIFCRNFRSSNTQKNSILSMG